MDLQPFNNLTEFKGLAQKLTIEKFHRILSYPLWNKVIQVINYTRSYEMGLETGLLLLKYADEFKEFFSEKEHREHLQTLYLFILHNLDKLDSWEEYLDVWEKIRRNADFSVTYSKEARTSYGKKIVPYILGEDDNVLYVHFLYGISYQKEVIERKLARKRTGKKLGNQFHARQDELTYDEIKERFEWIMKFLVTDEYDFNPPASRQKAKRKRGKDKTVCIKTSEKHYGCW